MNPNKKKTLFLGLWLAMLAGLIGVIAYFNGQLPGGDGGGGTHKITPPPKMDAQKLAAQWPQIVAHAAAPALGPATARYTLAEFGDFQCPQCGKARPLLEHLLEQYPTQINMIFVHRPFPQMHPWAIPAGQASEIAATQGKFWPMYDTLYAHQGTPGHQESLKPNFYGGYAAQAGLDVTRFQQALNAGQGQDKVREAAALADSLNIQVTPTVLVHDNQSGAISIYVGTKTAENPKNGIPYPGVDELVARPPWGG